MNELLPGLSQAPNVHPLLVHFPIALWTVALLLVALGTWRGREDVFKAGRWLVYLGALGAAASVATGYWATSQMGHDAPRHDYIHVHRDLMVATSILGLVTAALFVALRNREAPKFKWALMAALAVTVTVMTLGADRGAALVFQHGVGVAPAVRAAAEAEDGHEHPPGPSEPGHAPSSAHSDSPHSH